MIRYNKRITIKQTKFGLKLESDRGESYEITPASSSHNSTPVTTWWEKQAPTQLRRDQLDCIIKEYWRQHTPLDLFLVYKKGQGYSQSHDIMLAKDPIKNLWILSTEKHTWFQPGTADIVFDLTEALGPITESESRKEIYQVIDGISEVKNSYTAIC